MTTRTDGASKVFSTRNGVYNIQTYKSTITNDQAITVQYQAIIVEVV